MMVMVVLLHSSTSAAHDCLPLLPTATQTLDNRMAHCGMSELALSRTSQLQHSQWHNEHVNWLSWGCKYSQKQNHE